VVEKNYMTTRREDFVSRITEDILYQYYRDVKLQGDGPLKHISVLDVLRQRLFWALLLSQSVVEFGSETGILGLTDGTTDYTLMEDAQLQLLVAEEILEAIPYLWKKEIWDLATSGELPKHVIGDHLLPFHKVWFTFEQSCMMLSGDSDTERRVEAIYIDSSAFVEGRPGTAISMFTFERGKPKIKPVVIAVLIPFGATYPDDIPEVDREIVEYFLKLFSFLKSSSVEAEDMWIDSKQRYWMEKQAKNKYLESSRDVVKFVDLRKKHTKYPPESTRAVDWKYRWLVQGHHRAQWYPSRQMHEVKWIASYTKGPDDKPIKTPIYRVIR